uniref:Replication protein A 70 kDa DNA-binding subunit B/D first OB fold domain-containing protein n=1 Tax=Lactuca sativa TaxID=4236 RepID=A0A9R1WSQ0_LACSA|nr:hypothetical protein LSAT_V11C100044890 [Lactuca sativa]
MKKNLCFIFISYNNFLYHLQGTRIHATIKKNIINAFQALPEEGAVRQITNFGMTINEGDYMLVAHKHNINSYKTSTIRISTHFVDMIDPFNFVSFHYLTAINFDTRVAFDFIGQVVSTELMRVIKENPREKYCCTRSEVLFFIYH